MKSHVGAKRGSFLDLTIIIYRARSNMRKLNIFYVFKYKKSVLNDGSVHICINKIHNWINWLIIAILKFAKKSHITKQIPNTLISTQTNKIQQNLYCSCKMYNVYSNLSKTTSENILGGAYVLEAPIYELWRNCFFF